jgi:two-component system phosphate regulon response regulator PhoB
METVNIFLTDPMGETLEDFVHGSTRFAFGTIGADGPKRLADGSPWVFVDWVLPDLSGLEMCRRLRADARTADAHVTMVLEHDDPEDRRRALRAGADDYILGPLDRATVLDRVLALQARQQHRQALQQIEFGELVIDLGAQQARWQKHPIALRPNEFRLLRFLVENANRVLSRPELIAGLGKDGEPTDLRTVDVWIKRLRLGLRDVGAGHLLRTVHNKGYVLDPP